MERPDRIGYFRIRSTDTNSHGKPRYDEERYVARAHLNGSLNLTSASEVFSLVADILGPRVSRVPDGETSRPEWVKSLAPALQAMDGVERVSTRLMSGVVETDVLGLRDGVSAHSLDFSPVDFASTAIQSYSTFREARPQLAQDARFMVALPTPTAVIGRHFQPELTSALIPAFTEHLAREITVMTRTIPPQELALQWDVAAEPVMILGGLKEWPTFPVEEMYAQLAELTSIVPTEVQLGFHLCYGDSRPDSHSRGRHLVFPEDMELVVAMANRISDRAERDVNWFSMPVPIDQGTDTYFAPLEKLHLDSRTDIYLGVVHDEDGLEGSQERVDIAKRHLAEFGVATECGMGRIEPEAIRVLLEIHRDLVV